MAKYTTYLPEKDGTWKAHHYTSVNNCRKALIGNLDIEKAEIIYCNGTGYGSVKYVRWNGKRYYIFRRKGNIYLMKNDGSLGKQVR